MANSVTIELKIPIVIKNGKGTEKQINKIVLGRMKAKHLRLLPKNMVDEKGKNNIAPKDMLPIIGGLSGLSKSEVDEIDFVDLMTIADEIMNIMGEALPQETGKE